MTVAETSAAETSDDAFAGIAAQDVALATLRRALEEDRLASAYLFEGPSGVGKGRTALALARAVLGEAAWPRVSAGKHPDVRTFGPRDEGARNIKVAFLREEILPYAEFAPFEGSAAFLIFPEVDVSFPQHHAEAANAILKTLEEPKRGVHFVLLSERPERLLPTIRSRCQRLRFRRLPDAVLEDVLAREGIDDAGVRAAAIALADGRADRALHLAEEGTAATLLELALRVDDAVSQARPGLLVDVAEELAKSDELALALDTVQLFYREVAAAAAGLADDRLRFRHAAAEVRARAKVGARVASERVALVQQALADLEANANKQVTLDALVHRMRAA